MLFFAGKLILRPALTDLTFGMNSDCADLDRQPFGTFSPKTQIVRQNASIDWRQREQLRARQRSTVRRVHKYPPDQTEDATKRILEQAEALAEEEFGA